MRGSRGVDLAGDEARPGCCARQEVFRAQRLRLSFESTAMRQHTAVTISDAVVRYIAITKS
jgi:hypothetical protein